MHALPAVNVNFHFSHFLRLGDLFLYGTEPMICQIKRKGSWVGCLGWKRGARTTNRFDSNCIFQKILIKMETVTFENSLLFSNNGVNFENGVKNHILHDSRQMVVCSFLKIVILRIYQCTMSFFLNISLLLPFKLISRYPVLIKFWHGQHE